MAYSRFGSSVVGAQVEPVAVGHRRHMVLVEEARVDILGECMRFHLVLAAAVPPVVLAGTAG
jgi:hypothetical protein